MKSGDILSAAFWLLPYHTNLQEFPSSNKKKKIPFDILYSVTSIFVENKKIDINTVTDHREKARVQ